MIYNEFFSLWTNTMNRCKRQPLASALLFPALAVATFCGLPAATAQSLTDEQIQAQIRAQSQSQPLPQIGLRQFPTAAKRGILELQNPPEVLINGQPQRLSPGARIRDASNLLIVSSQLMGRKLVVNYLPNAQGEVQEVWLLNRNEAQEVREGSGAITNYNIGPSADAPKRDDGKTPFDQLPKFKN